ncbi:MAG TPA: hypothetical protein VMN99_05655 [Anaerolineales bacterium]|nr:hypothetical protein [Anaerolineales bacterium]
MFSRHEFRAPLVVLLLGFFLSQGCGEIPPTTALPVNPTILPPTSQMPTPFALPTATASADLLAAARIITTAIKTNQPQMLHALIGDEGVAPGGFAQGVDLQGYDNADEIVAAFDDALDRSTPLCEGFLPNAGTLPDKAILVYRGLKIDWSRFGFSDNGPDHAIALQLFKMPEGWRLIYITPFDLEWGLSYLGPLQDCPA